MSERELRDAVAAADAAINREDFEQVSRRTAPDGARRTPSHEPVGSSGASLNSAMYGV